VSSNVFTAHFVISSWILCRCCHWSVESFVAVLSARPDSVSNFVDVDAIFGPVMSNI
jgi:hypothetical protein